MIDVEREGLEGSEFLDIRTGSAGLWWSYRHKLFFYPTACTQNWYSTLLFCCAGMQIPAGGMLLEGANEKSISGSILLLCSLLFSGELLLSATFWSSASCFSPSFSPLCICLLFLTVCLGLVLLALEASCSLCLIWAFLSSPSRQNKPRPLDTETPSSRIHNPFC